MGEVGVADICRDAVYRALHAAITGRIGRHKWRPYELGGGVFTLLLTLFLAAFAYSQTPCRGVKIADGYGDFTEDPIEKLNQTYFSGDWEKLQKDSIEIMKNLQFYL